MAQKQAWAEQLTKKVANKAMKVHELVMLTYDDN